MTDDTELLRRYLAERSEPAFAELVQRHLGLVYATALRRVGYDSHLAEEVAQKVFTDLARKAPALTGRASLTGWLYLGAQVTSATVVRSERRRKARESAPAAMDQLHPTSDPAPDWRRLRPLLDEMLGDLRETDREALVLRFFEQRSFAEVGAALRVTEEAARKRVDRTLEKLRTLLARRGFTSTGAMIGAALGELGAEAAPAGLATRIAAQALIPAATPAGFAALAAWLKPQVLIPGALAALGTIGLVRQYAINRQLESDLAQAQADHVALGQLRAQNQQLARAAAEFADLHQRETDAAELAQREAITPVVPSAHSALALAIRPEGIFCFRNGQQVSLAPGELSALLQKWRGQSDRDAPFTIIYAQNANYAVVAKVLTELRQAGFKNFDLSPLFTRVKNEPPGDVINPWF